jgi:Ca-activated chloride channel homolog
MLEKETVSVKQARVAPMAMVMPMGFAGGGGRPVPPPAAAPAPAAPMAPGGPPPAAGYAPPSPAPRGRGGARSAFDEGVGAIRNRIAGRPAGRPAASPPAAEPGVDLRDLLAQEAARLHEAAQRPDYERRELLEDLGSRLAALGVAELRELVEALRPEEIARRPLDELWAHAIRVLEGYAGRSTGPESPRRSAFWKR